MCTTIGIHVQNNSSYEGQYRHYYWYHNDFVVMYVKTFKTVVTEQDQRGNVEITDKNFYIRISLAEQTIWLIMLSMLDSIVVDHGLEPQWILTNQNYKIDICCFSAKQVALRSKNKYWLLQNLDNVFQVERRIYPKTCSVS